MTGTSPVLATLIGLMKTKLVSRDSEAAACPSRQWCVLPKTVKTRARGKSRDHHQRDADFAAPKRKSFRTYIKRPLRFQNGGHLTCSLDYWL